MASTEERMRILMMVQEGKISAAEGARLIEALDDLSEPSLPIKATSAGSPTGKKPRYLRVMITDTDTGKARVNVRLPVSLINSGMRMGARFAPEIEGLEMEDLNAWLNSGEVGQIVDIFDEEDGEHIEVFLE
ncbi:MAG: SHOCT-like domain-containing protein [Brevefilum sp.]